MLNTGLVHVGGNEILLGRIDLDGFKLVLGQSECHTERLAGGTAFVIRHAGTETDFDDPVKIAGQRLKRNLVQDGVMQSGPFQSQINLFLRKAFQSKNIDDTNALDVHIEFTLYFAGEFLTDNVTNAFLQANDNTTQHVGFSSLSLV